MGVTGLWTIIQPCARPTNLATLNRKRLAVDASIWIYQFLKAVRDKEGNALRNSHVVGFFRRICKLLWFGILPVFVFDGGAPALKRATLLKRQHRREGRREDAVRTAGKLLAVQMQRAAVEEEERRKMHRAQAQLGTSEETSSLPEQQESTEEVGYLAEIGMTQREKNQSRTFHKQDAYHLPELEGGIASMGKPDGPRIMSIEELEEYARQFNSGEDINLYDFSKIDFDGDFFKSLPAADRYNILNAARLRSRLRMGYSKDQLDEMFPDRMAFSRFQIERVKERNHLTQRLMLEAGMQGTDLTLGVNARIAGDKDREYILVKNDGAQGGWALGVVSREKDVGQAHKPIDLDAIHIQYESKDDAQEDEDEEEFEDVPIEGLNRLPKPIPAAQVGAGRQAIPGQDEDGEEGSLFVGGNIGLDDVVSGTAAPDEMNADEEDDVNQAIAMSLRNQHGHFESLDGEPETQNQDMAEPHWAQRAADAPRPVREKSGSLIAHIFNNRASAAVLRRGQDGQEPRSAFQQEATLQQKENASESDSDDDMQAMIARSKQAKTTPSRPVVENGKNPFDGPLPFPELNWRTSLFANKGVGNEGEKEAPDKANEHSREPHADEAVEEEDNMAGGFEAKPRGQDEVKPLPPWLADETDIRESLKKQQDADKEINAADRQDAEEEQRLRQRDVRDRMIEIDSSSDTDSHVEIVDAPPLAGVSEEAKCDDDDDTVESGSRSKSVDVAETSSTSALGQRDLMQGSDTLDPDTEDTVAAHALAQDKEATSDTNLRQPSSSPEPEFEDVPTPAVGELLGYEPPATDMPESGQSGQNQDDDLFADVEYDEFSEPEDEELMAQMAAEAEEHARFASELNKKSAAQNREEYEKELRALRSQQKKDRRDADEVTQVMVTECQSLLQLFGIPYITAPMEAEAQCAELVKLGIVDGIVTDDSDTFLFGGTRVYKNMFNSNKFVECYLGAEIEQELSLSREQLISLAHLLGSDYTEGLTGVGPVTAVEILSEFPGRTGLEEFREWWTAVQTQGRPKEADASSTFRTKFRKSQATKLFLPPGFPNPAVYDAYMQPEVDSSAEPFQWGLPDVEGLRRFLMATIGWSKERTDEVLVPVVRDMNRREAEGTQSNITRFFGGPVGTGARQEEAFAPRQRGRGSKRMAAAVSRLRANVAGDGTEGAQDGAGEPKTKRRKRVARAAAATGSDG